ncbi:MAG: 50S ribosomal protein L6 [Gammaproteobacteria bacterium]|nr:50S ribosomal protein L6 [Gammaproteobacteria bacterium]MCH9716395.1 50S ribosomal protein L6 [Gammaproteobacteria bacterium]MCH9764127.1 50S ribosomal protein L6 [Gammaproteobacteria bacterium]
MSRIAKAPVLLPSTVELIVEPGCVIVKGPKGVVTTHCHHLVAVTRADDAPNEVLFAPVSSDPKGWAFAGTVRALVSNAVHGVTEGFSVTLELVGVGYRAQAQGKKIALSLGFSHPVSYLLPDDVTAEIPNNTTIVLSSSNKQRVGQVASEIRAIRPPEPYKGKGIRRADEVIITKEAKKK